MYKYFFTRSEIMKEKYIPADLEIILFGICDVITTSGPLPDIEDDTMGGSGIGGGYNPDGWN